MNLITIPPHGKKGKIVVIDGAAGVGKDTQFKLLVNHYKDINVNTRPVFTENFPRYKRLPYGPRCKKYNNEYFGDPLAIPAELASYPFMMDRVMMRSEIESRLEYAYVDDSNQDILPFGQLLMFCRYVTTNLAYQGAKFNNIQKATDFINEQMELEYKTHEIPREDLLIYLDAPWQICKTQAQKRALEAGEGLDGQEQEDPHMEKVCNLYREIAKSLPYAVTIDCHKKGTDTLRSIEDISQEVIHVVEAKL